MRTEAQQLALAVADDPLFIGWNPVYLAYCAAQGEPDPQAMLARDEARYPGGRMAGFILWAARRQA